MKTITEQVKEMSRLIRPLVLPEAKKKYSSTLFIRLNRLINYKL